MATGPRPHDDATEDALSRLERAGAIVIRVPRQWFATAEYAWDTHRGDGLVGRMKLEGIPTNETINPQEWAAVIRHDPLFGPDPDPHDLPKPDFLVGGDFFVEINKYEALAMQPEACRRPALAIPFPGMETYQIIDGWKRIYRAFTLGLTEYPVYAVSRGVEEWLRIPMPKLGL